MTKVLATGTFDLLHLGHLHFLTHARALGDHLTVVVAHDHTVRQRNKQPLFSAEDRRAMVAALAVVDQAVIGDAHHHLKIVQQIQPKIIALGYDQVIDETALARDLDAMDLHPRIIRLPRLKGEHYSSHAILERILQTKS